jgi:hypothetical protein
MFSEMLWVVVMLFLVLAGGIYFLTVKRGEGKKETPKLGGNTPDVGVLPIERVFTYLKGNYEERGYLDAIACPDTSYRDITKRQITDQLYVLVREVSLEYTDRIQKIEAHIEARSSSGHADIVKSLQASRDMMEQHLTNLSNIVREVKEEEVSSPLSALLDSYERGFMRGLASASLALLKGKQ